MTTRIKSMVNCRYLLLCVICIFMGACESQPSAHLSQGLVQPTDFTGPWEWVNSSLSTVEPSDSGDRYSQIPASETLRQGLVGYYESKEHFVMVVHYLRRYTQLAPDLGEFHHPTTIAGSNGATLEPSGTIFDLDVTRSGNSTRASCLERSSASSYTTCVVEVRYTHILSTLDFNIDNGVSKTDIEQILNEALANIDKRITAFDLSLDQKTR